MKFVHIADVHFDKPFTVLENNGLSEQRRLEQREAFHKVIEYCKKEKVELLMIAGDLYEQEYVRKSTIEFINQCFQEIEETTRVLIAPGNHDPYLANSYYHHYPWNTNVTIFDQLQKVEIQGIHVYGFGFTDFYQAPMKLPEEIDTTKVNIMLMHADVNGAKDGLNNYNPILETTLRDSKFDYIALGHIHKNNLEVEKRAVYPGSFIAGGFDELGKHGMVIGEIDVNTKTIDLAFHPVDEKEFIVKPLDISERQSEEEIIEVINNMSFNKQGYYKIELVGTKNIELNVNTILKHLHNKCILKVKDKTKISYDLQALAKEKNLRGMFVQELLQEIKEDHSNEEEIKRMIEIGLNVM